MQGAFSDVFTVHTRFFVCDLLKVNTELVMEIPVLMFSIYMYRIWQSGAMMQVHILMSLTSSEHFMDMIHTRAVAHVSKFLKKEFDG